MILSKHPGCGGPIIVSVLTVVFRAFFIILSTVFIITIVKIMNMHTTNLKRSKEALRD